MLSAVVQFSKARSTPKSDLYLQDIIRIIQNMPSYFSYTESQNNQEVIAHLDKIKKYREKTRNEYKTLTE